MKKLAVLKRALRAKIAKHRPAVTIFVFGFIFGKEAPRPDELKSLSVAELHDRTFKINIDACKDFFFKFMSFFLALKGLLELGAHDYVFTVLLAVVFTLFHMLMKVTYTVYCQIEHERMLAK